MEWPIPQPGHQVIPVSFKGHKLKWLWFAGFINAKQTKATIQNVNSKYLKKKVLINFVALGCKQ